MGLFQAIYVDNKDEKLDQILVQAISILQIEKGKRVYKNEALYQIVTDWAKANNIKLNKKQNPSKKIKVKKVKNQKIVYRVFKDKKNNSLLTGCSDKLTIAVFERLNYEYNEI